MVDIIISSSVFWNSLFKIDINHSSSLFLGPNWCYRWPLTPASGGTQSFVLLTVYNQKPSIFKAGPLPLSLLLVFTASFSLHSLVVGSSEKARIGQEKDFSSRQGQNSFFILYLSGRNPDQPPSALFCEPKIKEFTCTLKGTYRALLCLHSLP